MFSCYYVILGGCMRWVLAAGWRLVIDLIPWISQWRAVGAKIVFSSARSAQPECKLLICSEIWGLPVSFPDLTALTLEEEQQITYLSCACVRYPSPYYYTDSQCSFLVLLADTYCMLLASGKLCTQYYSMLLFLPAFSYILLPLMYVTALSLCRI